MKSQLFLLIISYLHDVINTRRYHLQVFETIAKQDYIEEVTDKLPQFQIMRKTKLFLLFFFFMEQHRKFQQEIFDCRERPPP